MTRLVLDASVALAWCFPDERGPYGSEIFRILESTGAVVPAIWPLEIANALVVAERKKRLRPAEIAQFLSLVDELAVDIDAQTARALTEILSLARKHGLSAYDAAYLELAMREGLPLATLDESLKTAAKRAGVKIAGSKA